MDIKGSKLNTLRNAVQEESMECGDYDTWRTSLLDILVAICRLETLNDIHNIINGN
jgi:hypothetical protein